MHHSGVRIDKHCAVMVCLLVAYLGSCARYLESVLDEHVVPAVDGALYTPDCLQRVGDELQVCLAVVAALVSHEAAVEIAGIVVNRAAAAVPPRQGDTQPSGRAEAALDPRVLVTPDHHRRRVPPHEQHAWRAGRKRGIFVEPLLEREIAVDAPRRGHESSLVVAKKRRRREQGGVRTSQNASD